MAHQLRDVHVNLLDFDVADIDSEVGQKVTHLSEAFVIGGVGGRDGGGDKQSKVRQ